MKEPNEIIGFSAMACMLLVLFAGFVFGFSIWNLLGIGFFGIIQQIFLSYWGLTTFNDKFAGKKTK